MAVIAAPVAGEWRCCPSGVRPGRAPLVLPVLGRLDFARGQLVQASDEGRQARCQVEDGRRHGSDSRTTWAGSAIVTSPLSSFRATGEPAFQPDSSRTGSARGEPCRPGLPRRSRRRGHGGGDRRWPARSLRLSGAAVHRGRHPGRQRVTGRASPAELSDRRPNCAGKSAGETAWLYPAAGRSLEFHPWSRGRRREGCHARRAVGLSNGPGP
jgi:hypothetical protein